MVRVQLLSRLILLAAACFAVSDLKTINQEWNYRFPHRHYLVICRMIEAGYGESATAQPTDSSGRRVLRGFRSEDDQSGMELPLPPSPLSGDMQDDRSWLW